jgi:hypothetical protein
VLLDQIPGKEIDGLVATRFDEKMLGDAVLNFVGVGNGGIAVEADELGEVVDAGDVAIGGEGLEGVLVASSGVRPAEKTLQRGGAEFHGEFAGVAGDGFSGEL